MLVGVDPTTVTGVSVRATSVLSVFGVGGGAVGFGSFSCGASELAVSQTRARVALPRVDVHVGDAELLLWARRECGASAYLVVLMRRHVFGSDP